LVPFADEVAVALEGRYGAGMCRRLILAICWFGFFVAAAASSRDAVKEPAEIPFQIEEGKIVIDVELKPGHTLPFVFDSGLSHGNLVTPKAAAGIGLEGDQELNIGDATGDLHQGKLATIPKVRVGEAQLADQLYAIVDIPEPVTARPGKPSLAGFLGAPLMRDAVLCVDFEHGRLHRWHRAAFKPGHLTVAPMKLNHELPTLEVKIDGQRATLIVDSGNNGAITVYPSFARRTNFTKRYPNLDPQGVSDGSGQSSQVLTAEADRVEFAPGAVFQHVPLAVIPQGMDPAWGIDGMVGTVVLSQLNPCLDRDGERFLFGAE
jgi:hypothetical protein